MRSGRWASWLAVLASLLYVAPIHRVAPLKTSHRARQAVARSARMLRRLAKTVAKEDLRNREMDRLMSQRKK